VDEYYQQIFVASERAQIISGGKKVPSSALAFHPIKEM
jgi:hypothetical protein